MSGANIFHTGLYSEKAFAVMQYTYMMKVSRVILTSEKIFKEQSHHYYAVGGLWRTSFTSTTSVLRAPDNEVIIVTPETYTPPFKTISSMKNAMKKTIDVLSSFLDEDERFILLPLDCTSSLIIVSDANTSFRMKISNFDDLFKRFEESTNIVYSGWTGINYIPEHAVFNNFSHSMKEHLPTLNDFNEVLKDIGKQAPMLNPLEIEQKTVIIKHFLKLFKELDNFLHKDVIVSKTTHTSPIDYTIYTSLEKKGINFATLLSRVYTDKMKGSEAAKNIEDIVKESFKSAPIVLGVECAKALQEEFTDYFKSDIWKNFAASLDFLKEGVLKNMPNGYFLRRNAEQYEKLFQKI